MVNHQNHQVNVQQRNRLLGHNSFVIWMTGLSGAGKTTIAKILNEKLYSMGLLSYVLDGDIIRNSLSKGLDFTEKGRKENIRRTAEVSKLMVDAGVIVIAALISPLEFERESVRSMLGKDRFLLVYLDCPIEICELRDPKGLYKSARRGIIANFTGISSVYEIPSSPDVIVQSGKTSADECMKKILSTVQEKRLIEPRV